MNGGEGDTVAAASAPGPATVSGVVILPPSTTVSAIAPVVVFSSEEGGQSFLSPAHKDGTFSQQLLPGTYHVQVLSGGIGGGVYVKSLAATGAKVSGRSVTIPTSGDVHLTLAIGSGLGVVKGVAKLAGKPTPGVMVLLVPASGLDIFDDTRRDQSDSDGSFTLSRIIPGRYVLMAIANAWNMNWTNPAVLRPYLGGGVPIEVAGGQTQTVTVEVQHVVKSTARLRECRAVPREERLRLPRHPLRERGIQSPTNPRGR